MRSTDRSSQTNRPSIELSPLKVRRLSISACRRFLKYSPADTVKTQLCVAVAVFSATQQRILSLLPHSSLRPHCTICIAWSSVAPAVVVFDVGQQLEVACWCVYRSPQTTSPTSYRSSLPRPLFFLPARLSPRIESTTRKRTHEP